MTIQIPFKEDMHLHSDRNTLHWTPMADGHLGLNGQRPLGACSNGHWWTSETSDVHPGLHIKSRINVRTYRY